MSVQSEDKVGGCADALFLAQMHLRPDDLPTSPAKPSIKVLQLEGNQSCSTAL